MQFHRFLLTGSHGVASLGRNNDWEVAMKVGIAFLALASASLPTMALAAELKIGFVTSVTGSQAPVARDMIDAFNLSIKNLGGKIAGNDVKVIVADDQEKPDVARQAAERLVERERVDLVTGPVITNMVLAAVKPVSDAKRLLVSINPGPSDFAGEKCNRNVFVLGFENQTIGRATGMAAKELGFSKVAMMGWNTPGARDVAAGFKQAFPGAVVKEIYTPPSQQDFAAEITSLKSLDVDGLYYFYPSQVGVNFLKQLGQVGYAMDRVIGTYPALDHIMLTQVGAEVAGINVVSLWTEQLDNPANKRFVATFREAYGRVPSAFAAQAYDLPVLLDAALRSNGGKTDMDSLRQAMKTSSFPSVRGAFSFASNQFPIQNFYVTKIEKSDSGLSYVVKRTLPDLKDDLAEKCPIKD
ncbi:ABC transporter substrate-binding protein [Boseaceae bacterium BT-24-1]|nr:ABC transporter substrate-binding protein [Boseaceae bacterium BT-24-1]